MSDRVNLTRLRGMKSRRERIVMLTAYNAWQTRLAEEAGADVLLVGDSVGMVEHGFSGTIPVTMEMMMLHCAAVARARNRTFTVGDMPFLSYEAEIAEAVRNAGRLLKEGGMDAVKLEGGRPREGTIAAIAAAGIPVVGHVGLTPQSATLLGGFRVQGKDLGRAREIVADAEAVERAGACMLVLECVPAELAAHITARLAIPTIGIGAGAACDGQVLVFHDVVGLSGDFRPRFVKRFAEGGHAIAEGLARYVAETRDGGFPTAGHSFTMEPEAAKEFAP